MSRRLLHPVKTRLIEFGRYAANRRAQRGLGKPESVSFLGFTFICGKSRQGTFQLKRKTRRDRMRAKLRAIKQEMQRRMHQPIPSQGKWLQHIVSGYFNYHAVPTNSRALHAFRHALHAFRHSVAEIWQRSLRRRSQKHSMSCPERGTGAALVLPFCNTEAMQLHLDEIAASATVLVCHLAGGVRFETISDLERHWR